MDFSSLPRGTAAWWSPVWSNCIFFNLTPSDSRGFSHIDFLTFEHIPESCYSHTRVRARAGIFSSSFHLSLCLCVFLPCRRSRIISCWVGHMLFICLSSEWGEGVTAAAPSSRAAGQRWTRGEWTRWGMTLWFTRWDESRYKERERERMLHNGHWRRESTQKESALRKKDRQKEREI